MEEETQEREKVTRELKNKKVMRESGWVGDREWGCGDVREGCDSLLLGLVWTI